VLTRGTPPQDRPFFTHTCDTTLCCNPAHLLPSAKGNRRTVPYCFHGHPFTKENTYREGSKRKCITCRNESNKRSRAALVAAASTHRLQKPNAETLAAAIGLFETLTATAMVYGVSDVTIRNWCDEYNIKRPRRVRRKKSKKRKKEIA
jgi:hypothetical protein